MSDLEKRASEIDIMEKISFGTSYPVMMNLMNLLRVREEIAIDPISDFETKRLAIKIQEDQIRRLLNFLT